MCVKLADLKKKKNMVSFLIGNHLLCRVHFLKPSYASTAQPAVHCSEILDSISGLSDLCVFKVSIAPLSALLNTSSCSSAHHHSPPRPHCGFWMELNTPRVGSRLARGWVRGPVSMVTGFCTKAAEGTRNATHSWLNLLDQGSLA